METVLAIPSEFFPGIPSYIFLTLSGISPAITLVTSEGIYLGISLGIPPEFPSKIPLCIFP